MLVDAQMDKCETRCIYHVCLLKQIQQNYFSWSGQMNKYSKHTLLLLNRNCSSSMTGNTMPQHITPTVIFLQDKSSSPNSPRYSVTAVLYHIAFRHMYIMTAVRQHVSLSVSKKPLYDGRVIRDVHKWKSAMYSTPFDQNIWNSIKIKW